ncbi:MAG: hypothetical protein IJU02_07495 [Lachnospiraceae bacterium]|nr:hypothetical protein [Lachnospiraceae bacterium]
MKVRQSAANELSNEQIQVLITGKFGDGCLVPNSRAKYHPEINFNYYYSTNSIHKEYIEYKKKLLGNLCITSINEIMNMGFKPAPIYRISSICSKAITEIACEDLNISLDRMNELGLALWFFDDGSLHKIKYFYNLNTQRYSKEVVENIIAPFLKNRFSIIAKPTIERKKDGREFWYLRVGKFDGAFIISEILKNII